MAPQCSLTMKDHDEEDLNVTSCSGTDENEAGGIETRKDHHVGAELVLLPVISQALCFKRAHIFYNHRKRMCPINDQITRL